MVNLLVNWKTRTVHVKELILVCLNGGQNYSQKMNGGKNILYQFFVHDNFFFYVCTWMVAIFCMSMLLCQL
jgi:hypothetical protein